MPNPFPYFPLYVNDFVADGKVEAMTTLEVGAYFLLLCKAWTEQPRGSIPDNDTILARWTRLTPEQWTECKPSVMSCFKLGTDNRWHQKRMEFEARKLQALTSTRSRAGKKGAESKWAKERDAAGCEEDGKANGSAIANADLCQNFANGKTMAPDSDSNSSSEGMGEVGGKETEKPPIFDHTAPGLAQTWCFHCLRRRHGCHVDLVDDVMPQFAEMMRLGHQAKRVHEAILSGNRDRAEQLFEFKKREGFDKPAAKAVTVRHESAEELAAKRAAALFRNPPPPGLLNGKHKRPAATAQQGGGATPPGDAHAQPGRDSGRGDVRPAG